MSGLTDQVNQSQVIASPGRSMPATNNEVLHNDQAADRVASSQSDDEARNKLCQDAAGRLVEDPLVSGGGGGGDGVAGESRPQSSLSTSTSSGSAQSNRVNSGTHTMCKFKDKRPEPLKLSANLNQEIPLDLSVKSAGNVPSGTLGNIFNLQTNQMMATLETPRIVWQDNEALLIKPRLFSSSTSASQRIKLSSLAGDSPPITPNTPFSDMICSPPTSAGATRRPHSGQPRSAGLLSYESTTSVIQALMSAQLQYNQHQAQMIEDKWAGKLLLNNNGCGNNNNNNNNSNNNNKRLNAIKSPSNNNNNNSNGGSGARDKHPPRRSCSTESLSAENNSKANFLLTAQRHQRHQQQGRINQDRFSYAGQPISSSAGSNSKRNNEANNNGKDEISTQSGKALTPTSLASATTNLLNINLNSPTNRVPPTNQNDCSPNGAQISPSLSDLVLAASHQHQQPQKSAGSSEGRAQFHTAAQSDVDPLLSAANCQQPSSGSFRSSLASAFSASSYSVSLASQPADGETHLTASENQLAAAYKAEASQQHQLLQQMSTTPSGSNPLGSFGGSTTLNTPTLISPSQLKNNNSLCFLPSPTLSPMSVFELPSPLLMFAPVPAPGASQPQQQQHQQQCQPQPQQRQPANRQASAVSPTARLPFEVAPNFNRRFNSELAVSKELAQVEQSSQVVGGGAVCSNRVASCDATLNSLKDNDKQPAQVGAAASELSLANLVTAAHNKLGQSSALLADDDDCGGGDGDGSDARNLVCMDVEGSQTVKPEASATHVGANFPRIFVSQEQQQQQQRRRICESADIQWQNQSSKLYPPFCTQPASGEPDGIILTAEQQQQQRMQRNAINKRALSPLSFRNRVSCYHNQRYESCSAPPDVNQCRARPKFKGLAGSDSPQQQQHHLSGSIACAPHDHHTSKPYPEPQVAARWPQPLASCAPISSGGHLSTPFGRPLIGTRPSSAEPLTDGQLEARTPGGGYQTPGNHQQGLHHHSVGGGNFSQSTQHLHSNQFSLGTNFGGVGSGFSQQLGRHSNNNLVLNQMGQQQQPQQQQRQQHQQHLQMQSASAGELHQLPSLSSCGPTVMGGSLALCSAGARQQQQQQQQRQPNQPLPPPPPHPPPLLHSHQPHQHQHQHEPLHQQHNQQAASAAFPPSMTELDHLRMQRQQQQHSNAPTLPFQGVMAPQQLCASNQLVQGQSAAQASWPEDRQQQQQQQQQQQPRALSADGRDSSMSVPMRPESAFSGSGSELSCFRSSSTTSSSAHANAAPKKYRCDQCSKSFTRSDMLTRHKRLHSGDRPFQCSECKQEFSRSDHLSTHVRTHTGEKPYKCKLCSYSACRKDMIARHMKVHSRSSPNAQQPTPI